MAREKKAVQIPYIEYDVEDKREYLVYKAPGQETASTLDESLGAGCVECGIQFHEPHEFTDTMEIVEGYRGRSAAQVELKSTTKNWYYTMFFGGFLKAMKKLEVKDGKFTGTFRHVQRGQNYGIELVDG